MMMGFVMGRLHPCLFIVLETLGTLNLQAHVLKFWEIFVKYFLNDLFLFVFFVLFF